MLGSRPTLLHLRGQCPPNPAQPCNHVFTFCKPMEWMWFGFPSMQEYYQTC